MSTRDLIDAIASGDAAGIQSAFESEMASRIADRLDTMRQDVAKSMFNQQEEVDLDEAAYHDADWVEKSARHERLYAYHKRMGNEAEAAKHKAEIDKLYKKEEVEKLDEISAELLKKASDTAYEKSAEAGKKFHKQAAHIYKNQGARLSKAYFDKQNAQSRQDELGSLSMVKKRKAGLAKEEIDLEEAMDQNKVHPNALHVQHVGGGKYKVHAVGKNFAGGIKAGEHLTDTELDDFSEMGGKIKQVK